MGINGDPPHRTDDEIFGQLLSNNINIDPPRYTDYDEIFQQFLSEPVTDLDDFPLLGSNTEHYTTDDEIFRSFLSDPAPVLDASPPLNSDTDGVPRLDLVGQASASLPAQPTHLPDSQPNTSIRHSQMASMERIPFWVEVGFAQVDCRKCFFLRETLHANHIGTIKMGIHGAPGVFYHAVLEVVNIKERTMRRYFADFTDCSYREVKEFLLREARTRKQEGMTRLTGSINEFQEALCTGMGRMSASGSKKKHGRG